MDTPAPAHDPLRTNVEIENAAVAFVIAREKDEGRTTAHDTRHKGAVADVESDERVIEVKAAGTTSRGFEVWLEPNQYDAARADPDRFWLYLVENVRQGDPSKFRLLRFGGATLQGLLVKAKPRHYYTLPVPVAAYDQALNEATQADG